MLLKGKITNPISNLRNFKFNNSHPKIIFLLFILFFNLNFFLRKPIDKIYYYPIILLIFISTTLILIKKIENKTKLSRQALLISFIFFLFIFLRFNLYSYISHYIYIITFMYFTLFLYFESRVIIPKKLNIIFIDKILNFTLRFSLLITIFHLLIHFTESQRGWVWPINIALQELVLICLLFSQITLFGLSKSKYNILLFLLILIFRESGKAAFFSFGLFISIYSFSKNCLPKTSLFTFLTKLVIFINYFVLLVGVLLFKSLNSPFASNTILAYIINKRFTLIKESFIKISNLDFFLWGGGFGTENYLADIKLSINNTPQFLILTLTVYGGLLFTIFFFYLFMKYRNLMLNKFNDNRRLQYLVKAFFFVLIFMLSFHEYFNNPILIFAISFFIYSLNIKSQLKFNEKS